MGYIPYAINISDFEGISCIMRIIDIMCILPIGAKGIWQRQEKNNRVPPDKIMCHYTLLCAVISDYFTIISIIAII